MSLKKPSEYFKKEVLSVSNSVQELVKEPELNTFSDVYESFKKNLTNIDLISENLDNYRDNIERVNFLAEKVEDIQNEIQNLLRKEDLDRVLMSQLLVVEQGIREVQEKVQGINEKNLNEIRVDVYNLTESVNTFLDVDVPKFKKLIVESEFRSDNKYIELEKNLNETIDSIGEFVDKEYIDDKLTEIDSSISTVIKKVKSVEILNSKKINEVENLQQKVNIELQNVEEHKKQLDKKVVELEVEILRNETHIKKQNDYIENIQEQVLNTISRLELEKLEEINYELVKKVKYIEEVFEKFNQETLTEGLLNEPPEVKNTDPLTPLNQNFVTLEQLQQHYKLFINRIQQQLSTLGGGGETRLKYLDDIVGIATNASAYDNKFLKYNHSIGKFEFVTVTGGGGGPAESYWVQGGVGIHTLSSVGIGTTNPTSDLTVVGNIVGTSGTFIGSPTNTSVLSIPSLSNSNSTNYGTLGVGRTVGFYDTNIIAHFADDVDSYSQIIVQNHNAGTNASADFIVNNNQEDGTQFYGDFGINSSNFAVNPSDPFTDPNGVYLYTAGGSLTLGSIDQQPIKLVSNYVEIARITDAGIGIGTTAITSALTVNGNTYVSGIVTATDFNSASDINLKENISKIENPLDTIAKLEGVNFQWKDTGKQSIGVIAQEVEQVLPELVSTVGAASPLYKSKTVNYNGIIALLIECVKEQQKEIEYLKKHLDK